LNDIFFDKLTNCFKLNVRYRIFFVLHKDRNNYNKITNFFSNFFKICRQQKLAFVRKTNSLYIRTLNYIKTIEEITLIKQVNALKIAIIK